MDCFFQIRLTNNEAFPVSYSLSLKVTENNFGDTMSYAALRGKDLLADNKKNHPANWADFLSAANALTFTGHGSFQDVTFQAGRQATPASGDILFDHCVDAPPAYSDPTTGYQVTVRN